MINYNPAPFFLNLFEQSFIESQGIDGWGQKNFHLSDASKCSRSIWFRIMLNTYPEFKKMVEYKDEPKDFVQQLNFSIGHAMHEWLQKYFVEKMHWCTWDDIEVAIRLAEINLKGSIDCLVPVEKLLELCQHFGIQAPPLTGTHVVIDFKTKKDEMVSLRIPGKPKVSSHTFPDDILKYPSTGYITQLQSYMTLAEKLHPEKYPEINAGILLYVCKNDGRSFAVSIEKDPLVWDMVYEKATKIRDAVETATPPPPEYAKTEKECCGFGNYHACPYFHICWSGQDLKF